MTYLRRSNPRGQKDFKKKAGAVALVVFLLALHFVFPHLYGTLFYPVTSFFWKSGTFVGDTVSRYAALVSSKRALIEENEQLRSEQASLQPSLIMLDSLRKENDTLRSLLGRHDSDKMTLATVLSRPPFSPYDSFILDAGTAEGVVVGDRVYVSTDVLIGDISEVYSHTSKVNLFSAPGRKVPVLVGASAIQVDAEGRGGGNFRATLPSEVGVEKGDSVRLAQSKSNVLGVVEEVALDSTDSLQSILFKMPLSISEISYVEIGAPAATSTGKR